MSWAVPNWWTFLLLVLAAYRTWRLLAHDTILDRPRARFLRRVGDKGDEWLLCPWCAGAWISLVWWLAWTWQPHWTSVVAVPLAMSAVLALVEINLGPAD